MPSIIIEKYFLTENKSIRDYSFQFYNYKVTLLSDIPCLLDYLRLNFLNITETKSQKEIHIIILKSIPDNKTIKKRFYKRKISQYSTPYYKCFLDFGNLSAFIIIKRPLNNSIQYYTIFQNTLKTILQTEEFFSLHASSWTKGEKSFLVIGKSGGGKSTLLTNALQEGYKIVGDDSIFITNKKNNIITAGLPYIGGLKKQNFNLDLIVKNWMNNSIPTHILFLEKSNNIPHFQIIILSLKDTLGKLLGEIFPLRLTLTNEIYLSKKAFALLYLLTLQTKSIILKINPRLLRKVNLKKINLWQKIEKII